MATRRKRMNTWRITAGTGVNYRDYFTRDHRNTVPAAPPRLLSQDVARGSLLDEAVGVLG